MLLSDSGSSNIDKTLSVEVDKYFNYSLNEMPNNSDKLSNYSNHHDFLAPLNNNPSQQKIIKIEGMPIFIFQEDEISMFLTIFNCCYWKDCNFQYQFPEYQHYLYQLNLWNIKYTKRKDIIASIMMPITAIIIVFAILNNNTYASLPYLSIILIIFLARYFITKKNRRNRSIFFDTLLLSSFISSCCLVIAGLYRNDANKSLASKPLGNDHNWARLCTWQRIANDWEIINPMILIRVLLIIFEYSSVDENIKSFAPLTKPRRSLAFLLTCLLYSGFSYFFLYYLKTNNYQPSATYNNAYYKKFCDLREPKFIQLSNIISHLDMITLAPKIGNCAEQANQAGFDEFVFISILSLFICLRILMRINQTMIYLAYKNPDKIIAKKCGIKSAIIFTKFSMITTMLVLLLYMITKILSRCTPLFTFFLTIVAGCYTESIVEAIAIFFVSNNRFKYFRDSSINEKVNHHKLSIIEVPPDKQQPQASYLCCCSCFCKPNNPNRGSSVNLDLIQEPTYDIYNLSSPSTSLS